MDYNKTMNFLIFDGNPNGLIITSFSLSHTAGKCKYMTYCRNLLSRVEKQRDTNGSAV